MKQALLTVAMALQLLCLGCASVPSAAPGAAAAPCPADPVVYSSAAATVSDDGYWEAASSVSGMAGAPAPRPGEQTMSASPIPNLGEALQNDDLPPGFGGGNGSDGFVRPSPTSAGPSAIVDQAPQFVVCSIDDQACFAMWREHNRKVAAGNFAMNQVQILTGPSLAPRQFQDTSFHLDEPLLVSSQAILSQTVAAVMQPPKILPKPKAVARIKDPVIVSGHETVLTLIISTNKSFEEIEALFPARQPKISNKPQPVTVLGQNVRSEIDARLWDRFDYVKARVWRCPEFLVCTANDSVKSTHDDLLTWYFPIAAKDNLENRSGVLGVKVYGDNDPAGLFLTEISEFPPLEPSVQVVRNWKFWEKFFDDSDTMITKMTKVAVSIGTFLAAIAGWFGWVKKKKAKEEEAKSAESDEDKHKLRITKGVARYKENVTDVNKDYPSTDTTG